MKPCIKPSALNSHFQSNISPRSVLAELIDNSLDANATEVEIHVNSKSLTVYDNGDGIEDINKMFEIGSTGRNGNPNAIGKFGVGAKHALLGVGKIVEVTSITDNDHRYIEHKANWGEIAKLEDWKEFPDPLPVPLSRLSAQGRSAMTNWSTRVTVSQRHRPQMFNQMDVLCRHMALMYRPALLKDITIKIITPKTVRDLRDEEYADPMLTEIIEARLVINGKRAKVRAGLAESHMPGLTGCVHVGFRNRIIESPRQIGRHNIPPQMFMEIALDTDWKDSLSTLKDGIVNDREELLESAWDETSSLADIIKELREEMKMEFKDINLAERLERAFEQTKKAGKKKLQPKDDGGIKTRFPTEEDGDGKPHPGHKKPIHDAEIVDGDKEVEEYEYEDKDEGKTTFKVIRDSSLGKLHCSVSCLLDKDAKSCDIEVIVNPTRSAVMNAYTEQNTMLDAIVAHALAEYFVLTDHDAGPLLFSGKWQETAEAQNPFELIGRISMLSGLILDHLEPSNVVNAGGDL